MHFTSLHRHRTATHRPGTGLHHQTIDDAADAGQLQRQHEERDGQRMETQPRDHVADVDAEADAKGAKDASAANEICECPS